MGKYRTDNEMLVFLTGRIQRLEKSLERLENLAMSSVSSGGNTKTFRTQESIRTELERAEREYQIINSRVKGTPISPHIKETIVCCRKS